VGSDTPGGDEPAAAEKVRAELARLGDDAASAPEVPAAVTERVVSALRAAPGRKPRSAVRLGAAVGVSAIVVAAALGTVALMRSEESRSSSAQQVTAEPPPPTVPLSDEEILDLLEQQPDLGAFNDPRRRSSCLSGLGYPASVTVLGGRPVEIDGQPAVLLVMPGDMPGMVDALAVRPNCSSMDTGLLADTQIRRP
jgi:hypothetical protein